MYGLSPNKRLAFILVYKRSVTKIIQVKYLEQYLVHGMCSTCFSPFTIVTIIILFFEMVGRLEVISGVLWAIHIFAYVNYSFFHQTFNLG